MVTVYISSTKAQRNNYLEKFYTGVVNSHKIRTYRLQCYNNTGILNWPLICHINNEQKVPGVNPSSTKTNENLRLSLK